MWKVLDQVKRFIVWFIAFKKYTTWCKRGCTRFEIDLREECPETDVTKKNIEKVRIMILDYRPWKLYEIAEAADISEGRVRYI